MPFQCSMFLYWGNWEDWFVVWSICCYYYCCYCCCCCYDHPFHQCCNRFLLVVFYRYIFVFGLIKFQFAFHFFFVYWEDREMKCFEPSSKLTDLIQLNYILYSGARNCHLPQFTMPHTCCGFKPSSIIHFPIYIYIWTTRHKCWW